MPLDDLVLPTLAQMLRALSAWLDKADSDAASRGGEADALMALRLAPDMLPLASQVRFACFQAREAVHRLRDEALTAEAGHIRSEGLAAGGTPGSLDDARRCIAQTLAFLDGALAEDAARVSGGDRGDAPVSLDLPNGMIFDMTRGQYVRDWLLPQFYFHLVTAYAILRHHGLALGKADLVPHMVAHLRPGAAPAG